MTQRFEHCSLEGSRITYLGRAGLFEDKKDKSMSEYAAWDYLEKEGWELISTISKQEGNPV
ncbi:MAG: hypothetical protein MUO76_09050, partial [Anaerolineaceae bacterium]|nr:hypothetical protein [Anaerolineaceae bacterium]